MVCDLVVNGERIATLKRAALQKPEHDRTVTDYDWLHFTPPTGVTMNEAIFMALRKADC